MAIMTSHASPTTIATGNPLRLLQAADLSASQSEIVSTAAHAGVKGPAIAGWEAIGMLSTLTLAAVLLLIWAWSRYGRRIDPDPLKAAIPRWADAFRLGGTRR
jgi:hypothetical protein